jgi:hypothetical protein
MLRLPVSEDPPRDREEFWIRFAFGVVFGTLLALSLMWQIYGLTLAVWLFVPAGALLLGLAAAYWGDRFWQFLLRLFRWW